MMKFALSPRRRRGGVATLLVLAALCVQAAPAANRFEDAVKSHRAGRHADAFGKLMVLAQEGDADAARILLFMHHYGPLLYGSYWDIAPADLAGYQELAASARGRQPPIFVPPWTQPQRVASKPAATAAGARADARR